VKKGIIYVFQKKASINIKNLRNNKLGHNNYKKKGAYNMLNLANQGIHINPLPQREGDKCRINYEGLLKKSGADQVYLHCGYGHDWDYTKDIPMFNTQTGAVCELTMEHDGMFNFCFKDSADHWDNNSGQNWKVPILTNFSLK
jgi:hypothetical protein